MKENVEIHLAVLSVSSHLTESVEEVELGEVLVELHLHLPSIQLLLHRHLSKEIILFDVL